MNTTTKAVVIDDFGPIDAANFREITLPEPGAGELLIDVAFVPANFVDTLVFTGKYQFLPERPFTPGKGPTGTVVAVGPDVTGFEEGDRVLSMAESGGYAGQAIVPVVNTYKLPGNVSCEDAAVLSLAFDTAWVSLFERGRFAPGETVLVLGATGAVGNAAIQLAHARGAKVIAAVSSPAREAEVRAAGADGIVDLSQPDLRNSVREQVRAQTDGKGADIVIDPIGGDIFDAALRAVAWRGRVVVIGFAAGRIPEIKANYLLLKNMEVSGIQVSDYRKRMPELMQGAFAEILSLAGEGKITAGARQHYPLDQWAQALDDLLNRKVNGRALLVPPQG
ncbi:NADPH:quinone oxidoreductase family protein [Chachezhania antarctica]|uniref:NADPH:quinone oxidoreductase family protein n=1 Tax=Chachezhania antarctica TaxID=2340860 RepID=UPI000EAD6782|nr:NADPH:quinone oxidoreductase family protein [Chachezhania antarctica]|tara:strand:+ start:2722 stop:3729 length:1008 start_codon:yes stop_codon:yes gene_type:complete